MTYNHCHTPEVMTHMGCVVLRVDTYTGAVNRFLTVDQAETLAIQLLDMADALSPEPVRA